MKIRLLLSGILFSLLLCTPSKVITFKKIPPEMFEKYKNQFVYHNGHIVCLFDSTGLDKPNICSHFGEIDFDTKLEEMEDEFGEPWKIINNDDGSVTRLFILDHLENEPCPYLLVISKDGKTVVLQITGKSTTKDLGFSGIRLGDLSDKVIETLGPPSNKGKVPDIGGTFWDYNPFKFSFEFINNHVYSIRIQTYTE